MIVSAGYEKKRLRLMAKYARGKSVLDLGYAQHPNPYLTKFHRVGVDLSAPSVPSGYDEEYVGDAMKLGETLAGRTFDTVICGELIEHVENPYDMLRGLAEVLAPDGRLLLSTPNPMSFPVFAAEAMRTAKFFYTQDHLYYFLPRWVRRMLEKTGYTLTATVPVGLWTPWGALPGPVAASYQVIYVAERS